MLAIGRMQRFAQFALVAVGVGAIAALLATGFSIGAATDGAVHPVAMAVLLGLLTLPLIRWVANDDQVVVRLAVAGLLAKAFGTYARFKLTGDADAEFYDESGITISNWLSRGLVGPNDPRVVFRGPGTSNLAYAVGWTYHITGVQRLTSYVIFSFLGFVGTLFFYRAAILAVPQIDRRRYAAMIFLLPTMLFWPSSVGKEAWLIASLGVATLGVSGLTRHRFSPGYVFALVFGLGMAGWVRPHMAALATAALVAAMIWPTGVAKSRARQLVGVLIALVVLAIALGQLSEYFGGGDVEVEAILDRANESSSMGGSEFDNPRISGPLNFIPGAITVLFRPLPFEVSGVLQLLTSLECLALLVLAVRGYSRLRQIPRLFLDNGFIRFAVLYTLGFIIAFSAIANFGLLARQRSQLWPVFLIFLALAPRRDSQETSERPQPRETAVVS